MSINFFTALPMAHTADRDRFLCTMRSFPPQIKNDCLLRSAIKTIEQYNIIFVNYCLCDNDIDTAMWQPLFDGSLKSLIAAVSACETKYMPPAAIQSALEGVKHKAAVDSLKHPLKMPRMPKLKDANTGPLRSGEVWGKLLQRKLDVALQANPAEAPDHAICIGPGIDPYGYPTYFIEMLKVLPRHCSITVFDKESRVLKGCQQFKEDDSRQRALSLTAFLSNAENLPRASFPYDELREALLSPIDFQGTATYHRFDFCENLEELPPTPRAKFILGTYSMVYITEAKKHALLRNSPTNAGPALKEYILFARNLYAKCTDWLEDGGTLFIDVPAMASLFKIDIYGKQVYEEQEIKGYCKNFKEFLNAFLNPSRQAEVTLLESPHFKPPSPDCKSYSSAFACEPITGHISIMDRFPIYAVTVSRL